MSYREHDSIKCNRIVAEKYQLFTFCFILTVVWNPWKEKAASMSDFGDDEYPTMICVEAGYVNKRKELPGGESFECGQICYVKKS